MTYLKLKQTIFFLLVLCAAAALISTGGCATTPTRIHADIGAEPSQATISFKGREVGTTPVTIQIARISELVKITAKLSDHELIETRIRFLSTNKAEVIFRFGTEPSKLAKSLGLTKVLIFDYTEHATFDTDKYVIKTKFIPLLEKQAQLLNKSFERLPVYVCGHTDNTGTRDYNLVLSLKRAQAVANFLAAHKVEKDRIIVQGFGEDYPLARNSTKRGRSLNRRTEILLPQ
jgi:outer membrane protein OmpA-like peptidoglycan-associated protein